MISRGEREREMMMISRGERDDDIEGREMMISRERER